MADYSRPLPVPDSDSEPYWQAAHEHRLEIPRCLDCGHYEFPPRHYCRNCRSLNLEWTEVSGRGTVYTFSTMRETLVRGLEPPYVVARVELVEQPGLQLVSNILECPLEDVRIGMPVEVTFEDVTDEITLPQFRPRRA